MTIVLAAGTVTFPSRFTLFGAMNPCPCGYRGDGRTRCRCRDAEVRGYLARLSGPLLDRIDLQIDMGGSRRRSFSTRRLSRQRRTNGESARVRERVAAARERAAHRFAGEPGVYANAQLGPRLVRRHRAEALQYRGLERSRPRPDK